MYAHRIPAHLETEDKFLFFLTLRQCIMLGIGSTIAYTSFFQVFTAVPSTALGLGFVAGLAVALLLVVCTVGLAFVKVYGRGAEEWAIVFLLYLAQPRVYLWRFAQPDAFEEHHQAQVERTRRQQARRHNGEEDDTW